MKFWFSKAICALTILATPFLQVSCFPSTSRIVGGQEARAGQFPYITAIYVTTGDSRFFCGGTLLNNEWVLTAAQCVDQAVTFTIQMGSNTLTLNDPDRVTVATSTYYIHPNYNRLTLDSDIGLIRLRLPVEFSDYITPVYSLPYADMVEGWEVLSAGWGQINDEISETLNYLTLIPITNEECRLTYGNQITDNMLCVAGNYNEGICIGDTGGPLIHLIKTGIHAPYGVASFISGNGCETLDPSGFTRVFPFVEWIKNITGIIQG